jgi:hypothetical protein
MVYPKMKKKNWLASKPWFCIFTPQRSKSRKKQKIQLVRKKSSKMASFTSFYQIKEVRPVLKIAQPDLLNEEEIEIEII